MDVSNVARRGTVEHIGGERVAALCNPYRLDGRVTTHPVAVRGWAPMNVYVLREGDHALVVDSGLTVHRAAVLQQLATLVDDRTQVSFLPWRYGELNPLCNYGAIAQRFGVARIIGDYFGAPSEWLDFLPEPLGVEEMARAVVEPFPTTGSIAVDPQRPRRLETFVPPVWLIPHAWAYDAATRTLFTPDVFSWVRRDTADGPWTARAEDTTSVEDVWEAMCANQYWWLPGARTGEMRADLAAVFDRYDVETVAPGYGCILTGRAIVERHVRMLDEVLERAADAEPVGTAVGAWRHDGGIG